MGNDNCFLSVQILFCYYTICAPFKVGEGGGMSCGWLLHTFQLGTARQLHGVWLELYVCGL